MISTKMVKGTFRSVVSLVLIVCYVAFVGRMFVVRSAVTNSALACVLRSRYAFLTLILIVMGLFMCIVCVVLWQCSVARMSHRIIEQASLSQCDVLVSGGDECSPNDVGISVGLSNWSSYEAVTEYGFIGGE
jgi:hypothetical protein